ncbi:hypothetical protein ACTYV9_003157 [Escherichia coli]|nr:hypothetical protein [Escherichia coli]
MSDKLITLAKILCVIVGILFSLMLVAIFLFLPWMMLSSSGMLG